MQAIAAIPGSHKPALVDVSNPAPPGQGQVLCRTLQLGVCGTDREILESGKPLVPPAEDYLILGHECLARVEQVGEGVDQFQQGDLVVPLVRRAKGKQDHRVDLLACGEYTERGIAYEHGFAASFWLDRPQYLIRVDDRLTDVAVFTEPLSIAEKGVNEALTIQRARLGSQVWVDMPPRVLVTGMGPIGFAGLLACRCRGWPVTVYGRDGEDSFRVAHLKALGGSYTRQGARLACTENADDGYDLILECTGSDAVLMEAAQALAPRAVMVWLGSTWTQMPREHNVDLLMWEGLFRNNVHLGCVNSAPRDFANAIEHLPCLLESTPDAIQGLITERVAPEDALWHYENRRPQGIKTVVVYDES